MGPGPGHATALRCFVAAWPDAAALVQLETTSSAQARQWPSARPVATPNLHLTLAFIGTLAVGRVLALQPRVDQLEVQPFDWTLDRLGLFRQARVLWLGGPPSAPLDQLAGRVRALLDAEGVTYDAKPFVPHVTLLRNFKASALTTTAVGPIRWPIRQVRLVVSLSTPHGPSYRNAADLLRA